VNEALLEIAKHGHRDNIYLIRFHYLPSGGWDGPINRVRQIERVPCRPARMAAASIADAPRRAATFALEGKLPEAIDFAERAFGLAPWSSNTAGTLAGLPRLRGDTRRAEETLGKLGPVCWVSGRVRHLPSLMLGARQGGGLG
jgi:hypothetical protein